MATSLNTDVVYPLSGETVFAGANSVTYTVKETGAMYLCALVNVTSSFPLIGTVTINSRAIDFYGPNYANRLSTIASNSNPVTYTYSGFVNLLSENVANINTKGGVPDKNGGGYLPVNKGDTIILTRGNTANAFVASFLYFK